MNEEGELLNQLEEVEQQVTQVRQRARELLSSIQQEGKDDRESE
jgi:hypothetical protein